jgi:hypothetical protein
MYYLSLSRMVVVLIVCIQTNTITAINSSNFNTISSINFSTPLYSYNVYNIPANATTNNTCATAIPVITDFNSPIYAGIGNTFTILGTGFDTTRGIVYSTCRNISFSLSSSKQTNP